MMLAGSIVAALALGQTPVLPQIVGDAVVIRVSSEAGEGEFVVPVDQLNREPGRAFYRSASPIIFPINDGFDTIAVLNSFAVEFVGASTIRLEFDATAGHLATHFTIASGNLDCLSAPPAFAGAAASLTYQDNNLDGGGLTGDYTYPSAPLVLRFAFGAFYDQRSPLNNPIGYLLSPLSPQIGHAEHTEGRLPVSGDLAEFPQTISRINSAFSFTLTPLDSARGSSVYFASPTQRCGAADIASLGGELLPDTRLTADDLIAYLGAFFDGDVMIADLVQIGSGPSPDGLVTADDLIAYLSAFFAGCP